MTDLIDRTHPLASPEFADANPDRVHVISNCGWVHDDCAWTVWRGNEPLRDFPTHAEAIRWAQANALIGLHAYIGGRCVGQVGEAEPPALRPEPRFNLTFPEPMEAP